MIRDDDTNPRVLADWFDGLVAEYSDRDVLADGLATVRRTVIQRRAVHRLVAAPQNVLLRHALTSVARYFRAADRGELSLREVADGTGIPLADARTALRAFVDTGILIERVKPAASRDRPSTRLYRLAPDGGALAAEVVVQAEEAARGEAVRLAWKPTWEAP